MRLWARVRALLPSRADYAPLRRSWRGDLLAGVAGALFCQVPAFEAACIAAYVCGKAGMRAAEGRGCGMLATDMLDCIPEELFGRPVAE